MSIMRLAKTNFMSWKATENFFECPEVILVTWENSLFELTDPVSSKREESQVTRMTSGPSKKISVASHDMKFVFASLLMIISMSQSKRDGRTTLGWDSMDGNASKWCFFLIYSIPLNFKSSLRPCRVVPTSAIATWGCAFEILWLGPSKNIYIVGGLRYERYATGTFLNFSNS